MKKSENLCLTEKQGAVQVIPAYRPYIECPPSSGDAARHSPLYFFYPSLFREFEHMKNYLLILPLIILCLGLQAENFVARISNPLPADYLRFETAGFDICAYRPDVYLDILMNQQNLNYYKEIYPSLEITQTEAQLKANLSINDRDIPGYRSYQQLTTELMSLQAQHPNLVSVQSIGTPWAAQYAAQGHAAYAAYDHQLWAVKLSDNVGVYEDEPCFYFVGEHHAREPISLEMVMGILNHLLDGYGTDPELSSLVDNSQIWFVPLLNPDGHKIVIDQTDVWWRKNLNDNNGNHTIDIGTQGSGPDGADLNRNYGYQWGYLNASGSASSITYHGSEAFSEVETQAFRDLLATWPFLAGISYHTYGEYVLYPFGYMYDIISPDAPEQQALANAMASTISGQSGGQYSPMPSYQLYPVSGSSDDWAYGSKGIFAYTIEMATEFIPPASEVPGIIQNNLSAAKLLLNRVNRKILKGHVQDALTGSALRAQIHVAGMDDNPLRTWITYSDSTYGSFYRFLPVGTYSVKFLCPGYETMVMDNVQILADSPTEYDVAMLPVEPLNMVLEIRTELGYPLPNAQLRFPGLAQSQVYQSNEDGRITLANWMPGTYQIELSAPNHEMLQTWLPMQGPHIRLTLGSSATLNEDFETDLGNWQTSGTWGRSTSNVHNGSYSLADSPSGNYGGNQNSFCRLVNPIPLQGVGNVNLQFWAKHNIRLEGDYCELMISTNGTQWQYLDHFVGEADWTLHSYNLNHLQGANLYLQFKLRTNASNNSDGIYIDDLKLYATSLPVSIQDQSLPGPCISISRYPNPFSDKLSFVIESDKKLPSDLLLSIYNLKGQLVRSMILESQGQISQTLYWDGQDSGKQPCANGVYFARLSQRGKTLQTMKTILMK